MKKLGLILLLVFVSVTLVTAQSMYENEYYKKSLEYRKLADDSYSNGDYDQAYDHAVEAERYARLSDEYIAKIRAKFQAEAKLSAAQRRMDYAALIKLESFHPSLYAEALEAFNEAQKAFDEESYQTCIEKAQKVIELLAAISPQGTKLSDDEAQNQPVVQLLPKFYTVRLIPGKRDCFWRIAEYDFVYADPYKWQILYEKNKEVIANPNNPHLIHPGQVFEIPSIKNEVREGTWDPEVDYPSIKDVR